MNSTTPPSPDPARPGTGAARQAPARRVRPWVWAVALGAAAVVGAGASLVTAPPPPTTPPTASEAATARAHDDAARLAAVARLLARSPAVPDDAARQGAGHVADVLDLQAGVLAASLSSPSPSQSAVSGPASEPPSGVQDSPALVVTGLSESAAARASDLPSVDGPTAALLASVATGQALEAARYAHAAGVPAPAPTLAAPEPTATPPTATPLTAGPNTVSSAPSRASGGPATSSGGQIACSAPPSQTQLPPQTQPPSQPQSQSPSALPATSALPPTQSRPASAALTEGAASGQAAFAAVEQSEQAAVWTYTVLAARTEAAARASNLAAAGLHEAQLRSLGALAERACAALPAPDAGFGLPADAGTPAQLAALEQSVTEAWSGLVGASTPAFRTTAAEGLLRAARRGDAVGAQPTLAASAFPGHAAGRAEAEALGSAAARTASATTAAPSPSH